MKTQTALRLTDLLGDAVNCGSLNLSDARRLSVRRPTIGRLLFVFVSPSEATDNQLGGQRSEEVVFAVHCSGIERRAAINCATDFRAGVHDCVCLRDQWPSDVKLPEDDQSELCFVPSVSRTNHSRASASKRNRRQAVAGHGIERGHGVERAEDLRLIAVWS